MAPREPSQDRMGTPDVVQKGFATADTIRYVPCCTLRQRLQADLCVGLASKYS